MITIIIRLLLLVSLHATIDRHHVTTLVWTQPRAAQLCIYDQVLLFCGFYGPGAHVERLGTVGPLVAHVQAGDVLTLREVGGASQQVKVGVPVQRLPIVRR